jgi:hypothetical protein
MTSGSAYGCRHRLANKLISAIAAPAWSRASTLPSLVGLFFATAVAGAAAHEIIDVNTANELVAAADSAVDQESKASDQGTKGGTLYLLGAVLVEATDLLNRDVAAHSGQLTLNGQLLLKGFAQRHLAPQFDEALKRYLLPRQQLQEAIRLAPAASYAPRARFALLKSSFYESFAFDPFKPLHADISALQQESSEAEALVPLLEDADEREEAAFIHAIDLAREVKLAGNANIASAIEPKARAALKAFVHDYPDSMRAASASVILQGIERTQR